MLSRRGFIGGLLTVAAPAIIRPGILMPVKPIVPADVSQIAMYVGEHYVDVISDTHWTGFYDLKRRRMVWRLAGVHDANKMSEVHDLAALSRYGEALAKAC